MHGQLGIFWPNKKVLSNGEGGMLVGCSLNTNHQYDIANRLDVNRR